MLYKAKKWFAKLCWDIFSLDQWKQKSQTFAIVVGISFILSLTALIAVVFAYIDIHVWSKEGSVILVPEKRLITIQDHLYIPIKIIK